VALGRTISTEAYDQAITTQCINLSAVKEVPPIFLIAGLTDSPKAQCKAIADNIIVPAVILHLPERIESIQKAAEDLVKVTQLFLYIRSLLG